jgi:capsular polysaccharide export protein
MRLAKHIGSIEMRAEPANWGNSWHHIANSLIYYSDAFRSKKTYPNYTINSYTNVTEAALFYIRRLAQLPIKIPLSFLREWRLLQSRQKYDLVLLQLSFDSSMYEHSNYKRISDFIEDAIAGFSEGAPKDHALVFKTHPFEDGRDKLQKVCRIIARSHGIAERVIFIDGGNLGLLLDNARSVVTINSTAAQQALWRGLPVRAMGRSVYGKSELVSNQNLADFFRMPIPPDRKAYEIYRKFLLATSQVEGGFYSESARALALGRLPTLMCAPLDPYDTAFSKN